MSVNTQLDRLKNAKAAIKTAIEGKGVTVPSATKLDEMAPLIESITPTLQSKSVTITSNGTINISPDSGYDGLSEARVNVNVKGSAKTCSIDLSVSGYAYMPGFSCLQLNPQGNIVDFSDYYPDSEISISPILTDSLFVVCTKEDMSVEVYGGVIYLSAFAYFDAVIYLFKTPSDENVTGTINLLS